MKDFDTGMHYPIKLDALPESWSFAYFGDVCSSIQSGFACGQHGSDDGIAHLRPMNICRAGTLDLSDLRKVPAVFNSKRLDYGDVLFNNTNSPELIGKTAHVGHNFTGLAFSNHMTQVKLYEGVDSRFAAAQLHYLWSARYFLHRCVKHVNQASISTRDLATSVPFVIPPPSEQQRIVTKLDELFSELDQGVENLRTAQQQLKVYRQALLKHAFEGKLTAEWRAQNPDKLESTEALLARIQQEREARYRQQLAEWQEAQQAWEANSKTGSKPAKPKAPKALPALTAEDLAELSDLPTGWRWAQLGMLIDEPCYGTSKKCSYESGDVGVLRIPNISAGRIDARDLKFADFDDGEITAYGLKHGDLLTIRSNGSISIVGQCALITEKEEEFLYAGYLIRLRPNPELADPSFLLETLRSHTLRKQIEKKAKSTSGVNNINSGEIQSLVVPLCSVEEQEIIKVMLSEKLSNLDQLENTITTSLQQAEALRQSILKKAFSGQLVPQHPDDEPASVLLERIRAERTAQPKARGRKTKAVA